MFAETFVHAFEFYLLDTTSVNAPLDYVSGNLKMAALERQGTRIDHLYIQLVCAMDKLIPFYRYYFPFYKLNKKAVVLELMAQLSIHDQELFDNVLASINNACGKKKDSLALQKYLDETFVLSNL